MQDEYYEGAAIRAKDYWSLKKLGRQLARDQLPPSHPLYANKAENLERISILVPSRQVDVLPSHASS